MEPTQLIPRDLLSFLRSGSQLVYDAAECECGQVILRSPEQLREIEAYVDADHVRNLVKWAIPEDEGYFAIRAIDLLLRVDHYPAKGVLVWLPGTNMYGTWDNDHYDLLVFPSADWHSIVGDPLSYLNAQWHDTDAPVCRYAPRVEDEFRRE